MPRHRQIKKGKSANPDGNTDFFTLTFRQTVLSGNLLCAVSSGSLNNLSSLNSNCSVIVSVNCYSLLDSLCYNSVRVSCLSSLVAAARYESYAEKNSKRINYFLHLFNNLK